MQTQAQKIIVILGPTASGKSGAAIQLAKKFNGEIISADSRQVYRGMDVGTGKVTGSMEPVTLNEIIPAKTGQMKSKDSTKLYISEGIAHHLIDVAEPNDDFNISHFKILANLAIENILSRGKLPIICGGTGFWIDAIVNNTQIPEVPPNEKLRNMLRSKSAEELFEQLQKLDPERAATIDKQNPVRLIRALEIIDALGKVPSLQNTTDNPPADGQNVKYDFLEIGITVPRETLNEKIKKRLDERFEDGMIEEVKNLNKDGVSWERLEYFGLEYRWIARYLQEKVSLDEMREKLYFDIIHYAKRQMTWFKRNKKIVWRENYEEIENNVGKFLK